MNKLIKSLSIENYRGYQTKQVLDLADLKKITFLIGQNNSGKSLIAKCFGIINKIDSISSAIFLEDTDFFNIEEPIRIQVNLDVNALDAGNPNVVKLKSLADLFISIIVIKRGESNYIYNVFYNDSASYNYVETKHNGKDISLEYKSDFYEKTQLNTTDTDRITNYLISLLKDNILIFSPIRSFQNSPKNSDNFKSGIELITWLNTNRTSSNTRSAKAKVGQFLKRLNLEEPSDVSSDTDKLNFTFSNHLILSSNDVGTGYTMIYILIMEIIRNNKIVIIIDEIESHLQPGLIRELIKIIREICTGQVIISTHSPTVIESAVENDYLYRFQKSDGKCFFEKFFRDNSTAGIMRSVFNELGVIPGDALLSNCVIWVEGPSEVKWLRKWMKVYFENFYKKKKDCEINLLEGLHYSILMTGGSSIANISFEEQNHLITEDFDDYTIKVLRVNPNAFVIIDSDNSKKTSGKFQRCLRIGNELNCQNKNNSKLAHVINDINETNTDEVCNLWLLKGRELENYAHPELVKNFYLKITNHGNSKIEIPTAMKWDVFSDSHGAGSILEGNGMTNVRVEKGTTIIHKQQLAEYIFENLESIHFEENPLAIEIPNKLMIENLKINLEKLFDYILIVNNIA